jgi:hypothetical protein
MSTDYKVKRHAYACVPSIVRSEKNPILSGFPRIHGFSVRFFLETILYLILKQITLPYLALEILNFII